MAGTTWTQKSSDASFSFTHTSAEEPDRRLWSQTDLVSNFSFTLYWLLDESKLSKLSFLLGKIRKYTHLIRLLLIRGSKRD